MLALIILPLYVLVNIYLANRFFDWLILLNPVFRNSLFIISIAFIFTVLSASVLLAALLPKENHRKMFRTVGNYWLGILIYAVPSAMLIDLGSIMIRLIYKNGANAVSILLSAGGFVTMCTVLFALIFGRRNAKNISIVRYGISVNKVSKINSLKIALLADVHLGANNGKNLIKKITELINSEHVDLVCIAGDLFDSDYGTVKDPSEIADILQHIESKYGTFACWGNHDSNEKLFAGFSLTTNHDDGKSTFQSFFNKANIKLLEDESLVVDDSFIIIGRKDPFKVQKSGDSRLSPRDLTRTLDKTLPIIVMDHQPKELQELSEAGVDIDLSGHTHNGQIFPGNFLIGKLWDNPHGVKKKDTMWSCVTSGVGAWGPNLRIGTNSEIVILNVDFKGDN